MEVASPLTLGRTGGVPKRHFSMGMETTDDYMAQRSFKRRRFNMDVSMDGDSENKVNQSSFPSHSSVHQQQEKTFFSSPNGKLQNRSCVLSPPSYASVHWHDSNFCHSRVSTYELYWDSARHLRVLSSVCSL